jgi:hypothetical protein
MFGIKELKPALRQININVNIPELTRGHYEQIRIDPESSR